MSGYVYGFAYGFLIAYSSALLGSVACFYLGRRYFKKQVRTLMAKNQSMKSIVKAVEKRGFKLLLLIRLAPYPFNLLNLALSATHIPLKTFALATAVSLTKLTLHVYIGSTLSSLAPLPPAPAPVPGDPSKLPDQTTPGSGTEPGVPPSPYGRNIKVFVMIFSMLLGIAVSAHVWIVAKREIAASEGIRIERRRKRRESRSTLGMGSSSAFSSPGRHTHRNASAVGGGGGARGSNEFMGGQEYLPSIDLANHHNRISSDFVGGAYLDDEEVEGEQQDEGQALFTQYRQHRESDLHRGRIYDDDGDEVQDSDSGSDESDFLQEDDQERNDIERGHDGLLEHNHDSSWHNNRHGTSSIEMRAHTTTTTMASTTTTTTSSATPFHRGHSPRPSFSILGTT
ncbi:hypothetical protein BGZ94_007422 [Podila epigama]|nr:hypothetical protein BGZ94_007422 [Podila epigama]